MLSRRPVSRREIGELLWPDEFDDTIRPRLRTELHRLRSLLGPAAEILVVERDSVALDRRLVTVDVEQFEERLRFAAMASDDLEWLAAFESASELYTGDLLPHETDSWFESRRISLTETFVHSLERAARIRLARGETAEAIALARRAFDALPLRTETVITLMTVLAESGDTPGALGTFDRYEQLIAKLLSLAPDSQVSAFAERIRLGKTSLAKSQLATPESQPASLPAPSGVVFGREAAVASLCSRLMPEIPRVERIWTLLGPGGAGKTTVALEVGRRLLAPMNNRVFFVPLFDRKATTEMMVAVAQALGIPSGDAQKPESVLQRLGNDPAVLILDNFEQLPDTSATWVGNLAKIAPNLRIVVTSRKSLEQEAEQRVLIEPFMVPVFPGTPEQLEKLPSVALFLERARRVLPGYEPGLEELGQIVQLTARLGGLPLAIVLAASQISSFTPQDMLHDFAALAKIGTQDHEVVDRHRSLGETLAWSIGLLRPDARRFLHDLCVFPGQWSLSAARRVLGPHALEVLPLLVDHSLVIRRVEAGTSRFEFYPMVREHLLVCDGEPSAELQAKHASWVLVLLDEANIERDSDPGSFGKVLDPETMNIEAALGWLEVNDADRHREALVRLWRYWMVREWEPRRSERLWAAANAVSGEVTEQAAELNHGACLLLTHVGRYAEAEIAATRGEKIYRELGDLISALDVQRKRVHTAYYRFDFEEMKLRSLEGIERARSIGAPHLESAFLGHLGLAYSNLDMGEQALEAMERQIELLTEQNDGARLKSAHLHRAVIMLSMRRWDDAGVALEAVLRRAVETHDIALQSHCYTHLTTVMLRTGRTEEALKHLETSVSLSERSESMFAQGVRNYLGTLIGIQSRDAGFALQQLEQLLVAWNSVQHEQSILPAIDLAALALASFGQLDRASALLNGADAIRDAHRLSVSPHYRIVWEDARQLIGTRSDVAVPESFEALARSTRKAVSRWRTDTTFGPSAREL